MQKEIFLREQLKSIEKELGLEDEKGEYDQLRSKIKKDKPVITCCASGMRSGSAVNVLKSNGFQEVYNGGSWFRLQSKLH